MVVCVLIGVLIGGLCVQAQTTNTFWISPGAYPGANSYTVSRVGSLYYAKDQNGFVPSWGYGNNNCSEIIETASASDADIKLLAGSYVVSTDIDLLDDIKLKGLIGKQPTYK